MLKIKLNGKWDLECLDGKNSTEVKSGDFFTEEIPMEIHDVLFKNKVAKDPYFSENDKKAGFIETLDWVFKKEFKIDKRESNATLFIPSVDSPAEVILNNELLGRIKGEFCETSFDVSDRIKDGKNNLEIKILHSEDNFRRAKFDNGPAFTKIGIYKEPEIVLYEDYFVKTLSVFAIEDESDWNLISEFEIDAISEARSPFSLNFLKGEIKDIIEILPGSRIYRESLKIKKDEIEAWWPNGMGKQHRYYIEIQIGDEKFERLFGFRSISLSTKRSEGGKEMAFSANGKRLYVKGAILNPVDYIPSRASRKRYERLVELARDASFNMIRIKGNGSYPDDELYDECDRLGILIWQDLMFSKTDFLDRDDIDMAIEEIKYQVRRLKDHPSVAMWCITDETLSEINKERGGEKREGDLIKYTKFIEKANSAILEVDPYRPIWPSSPSEGEMSYLIREQNGDSSIDLIDDYSPNSVFSRSPRLVSSISFPSLPSKMEASLIASEDEINITSPSFENHSKDERALRSIVSGLTDSFRFPPSFAKMSYLSGTLQALLYDRAISYFRTLMPYNSGVIVSSLNSPWPCVSDSIVEYSGIPKLAYYAIKRSFQAVVPIIIIDGTKLYAYVSNDSDKEEYANLKVKFRFFNGFKWETYYFSDNVRPMETKKLGEISLKGIDPKSTFCYAKLKAGSSIREKTQLLVHPKEARLEDPRLNLDISRITDRDFNIKISSEKPAFWVTLDQKEIKGTFSDNFIAVRPSTEKNIIFHSFEEIDEKKLKEELRLFDLYTSYRDK